MWPGRDDPAVTADVTVQRGRSARPRLLGANTVLVLLALLQLLVHLLTAENYGYFRDELYYMAAGERLGLGYVDFPPFIALVTAFVRATLGDSLLALRLLPALAGAAVVVLAGSWRESSEAEGSPRASPLSRSSSRPPSSCSGLSSRWTPSTSSSRFRRHTCYS